LGRREFIWLLHEFQITMRQFLIHRQTGKFDFQTADLDGKRGFLLEVDLSYSPELHEAHSDLPLAPEHIQ